MSTDQRPPEVDGDERETLLAFLDYLRDCAVRKLSGIDEALARQELVPSGTTLYWLALHLSAVEINQFQRILAGRTDDQHRPPPPGDDDTLEAAIARYELACDESRRIVADHPDLAAGSAAVDRSGVRRSVRWILAHMVEETARHLGHADILREQVDGSTGR